MSYISYFKNATRLLYLHLLMGFFEVGFDPYSTILFTINMAATMYLYLSGDQAFQRVAFLWIASAVFLGLVRLRGGFDASIIFYIQEYKRGDRQTIPDHTITEIIRNKKRVLCFNEFSIIFFALTGEFIDSFGDLLI